MTGFPFAVPRGTTFGLLGANGAGKTTTILMLLGLLRPDRGEARVLGHDMEHDRFRALQRANFSSPYVSLPHRLTARQNLTVYGRLYGVANVRRRIEQIAQELRIEDLLDRPVGQMSAGQKTRVGIGKVPAEQSGGAVPRRADRLALARIRDLAPVVSRPLP